MFSSAIGTVFGASRDAKGQTDRRDAKGRNMLTRKMGYAGQLGYICNLCEEKALFFVFAIDKSAPFGYISTERVEHTKQRGTK